MKCLFVAGTTTACLLRRGIHTWEDKNTLFVCDMAGITTECQTTPIWNEHSGLVWLIS